MELYRYEAAGAPALSAIPDLPLPRLPRGEDCPERFLLRRGGGHHHAALQMLGDVAGVIYLADQPCGQPPGGGDGSGDGPGYP